MAEQISLKNFIRESLVQVIDGVAEAQVNALEKGARINPMNVYYDGDRPLWSDREIFPDRQIPGHEIAYDN